MDECVTIDKPTSDFTCSHCGEGLRDDLLCDGCRGCHTHCPYSGAELFDECGHLLFYEGLDGASCPVLLPTELPHLAACHFMISTGWQAGIVHGLDFRLTMKEFGDGACIARMGSHAIGKGRDASLKQPAVEGRRDRPS